MEHIDCAVIGAGVVGLAIARELAASGREVVILEEENAFGTHTSSRNSEVMHAGISYPAGTWKARLCRPGNAMLARYCAEHGIAHQRPGKLLLAVDAEEEDKLDLYLSQARASGVDDLRPVSQGELREIEPALTGRKALFSPSTGIIDAHGLMLSLLGEAQQHGAALALCSPVMAGRATSGGIELEIGGAQAMRIRASLVINAAGLRAADIAASIDGIARQAVPRVHYAIGHYFTLRGPSPFKHLVYPVARSSWQRVHVTLDLAGQCKFGPDLQWRDQVDYRFDETRAADFYRGVRRYYPALADGDLVPGYTGIRPRLAGPDEPLTLSNGDFCFQTAREHGVSGLINLLGIESPGLTSCLAIARQVRLLAQSAD